MLSRKLELFWGAICLSASSLYGGLQSGDLVAIVGDSITAQCIYSRYLTEYLVMCQPSPYLEAVQFGWGGEFAGALLRRLDHDVGSFQPEVVTLLYGMNDGRYQPLSDERLNAYRESMTTVVHSLKDAGTREIYLASPGPVDPAYFSKSTVRAEDYNQTLRAIGQCAREIAESEGVHFVDVNRVMAEGMAAAKARFGADYQLAPDGIHPRTNGHLLIASAFLKGMDLDGEIGRITVDYQLQQAECDAAQTVLSFREGALEMKSSRYPFIPESDGSNLDARTMASLVDFHRELNRYLLVVQNAPEKLEVCWGNASRIYSADELAKGINLAADYYETPFDEAFAKVSRSIAKQQQFERVAVRQLLNSIPAWEREFSDTKPELAGQLRQVILEKSAALRKATQSLFEPVRHTILLKPVD
ncbi:SGNH/GDSL hydrolase family protein [Coraliomargarita parva]|uniref:SGNH/GDSL hydrolase family protein n=1 Tax=Coraliomargarita parva TaxID=3014050 RepID=UPI0022B4FA80|nr:SGNH/GDSL hydrolase family protein [Coraliomargarita parva]